MRVRRSGVLIRARDERGAVLMMVAICLLVLLGMLVLTFDLGRGVAIKRNMVAGADAAALAAARECGLADGEAAAKQAATDLLVDNNGAATVTSFEITPSPAQCSGVPNPNPDGKNEVTVTASVPQEYFFAQIFGFNEGTVVASATATWEAGVVNPAPLKLEALKVEDCTTGGDCFFEFEKEKTGSQRGWLDFPQGWPVQGEDPNPMDCSSQAGGVNELSEYIRQMGLEGEGGGFMALLWEPPPTYVCGAGGVPAALVQEMEDWLNAVALMNPKPVVYFPVVACDGDAAPCFPWIRGSGAAYPVVELKGFRVEGAWGGPDARRQANCEFERRGSDVFCIQLSVAAPGDPSLNNAVRVRLVD